MKKPSKDTILVTIGSAAVLALFALNIVADSILDNQKEKMLSTKFNDVTLWDKFCTDSKGKIIHTQSKEGLSGRSVVSFVDDNGCVVQHGKSCKAIKCPKPGK